MDTIFAHATIVYTGLFLALGIILLTAYIPRDKNLAVYRTGRRIFACAYLLLGATGVIDLIFIPSDGERSYITIYSVGAVSMIHAWLNTYAYLLLQEPSQKSIRSFRRYGVLGLPLILLTGGAMIFLPQAYIIASFALGAAYVGQICWTISVCYREYRANVRAMENYYDGTLRFSWMNGALMMTLVLALLNLASFYTVGLSLLLRVCTTLFYLYFAIRLLNYMHIFIYVGEARKEEGEAKSAEDKCSRATGLEPAVANGYSKKLLPSLTRWCEAKRFCQDSLTIKMVAYEMDTNHTYLSAYLNKQLDCSFQQWLNNLRINESKILFKEHPNKTIEEIGGMVGIPQSYNFSRWFKHITGLSPQQWRKQADLE